MLKKEIQQRAKAVGVKYTGTMKKAALIRAIQSAEGNVACFNEPLCDPCQSGDCAWRMDCTAHPAS